MYHKMFQRRPVFGSLTSEGSAVCVCDNYVLRRMRVITQLQWFCPFLFLFFLFFLLSLYVESLSIHSHNYIIHFDHKSGKNIHPY